MAGLPRASKAWKVLSTTLVDIALVLPTPAKTAVVLMGKLANKTYGVMEARELSETNQQYVVQLAERSIIVSRTIELSLAQGRPQDEVFEAFVSSWSDTMKDVVEFGEKFAQQGLIGWLLNGNEVKSEFKNLWRRMDALLNDYRVYLLQNMACRGPYERIEHPELREFWISSMNNVLEAKWVHFWDALLHSHPELSQFLCGPFASNNMAILEAKVGHVSRARPRNAKFVGPWEINNLFQPPNGSLEEIISTALAYNKSSVASAMTVSRATGTSNKICTRTVTCWTGYWMRGSYKALMTAELLVATNHKIYGGGSDEIGEFTCTGEWGGEMVHFIKHYIGLHQVEYDGAISNTIMNGQWTKDEDLPTKGDFVLQQRCGLSCNIGFANGRLCKLGEIQRWSGYYQHCQGEGQCKMTADIVFTSKHRVYGSGLDPVGRFTLLGRYHQTSHSILVTINKQYKHDRHIIYMGAVSHPLSVGQEDRKVVMEGSWVINTTGLSNHVISTTGFSHHVDHGKFCLEPELDN